MEIKNKLTHFLLREKYFIKEFKNNVKILDTSNDEYEKLLL